MWQTPQRFTNRGQWMRHRDYRRFVSGPASVLGRTGGFLEAVVRYVEAKCLLGGVTTSQGIALASNMGIRRYYKGLVRNVEDTDDEALPAAATRVADVEAGTAKAFLKTLNRSSSLLLHLAEGVDDAAREHFTSLRIGTDEWAITPSLCGIHCAGLHGRDYQIFRARGGSMVWSPLSNLLLYGGTADIERAKAEELPVALGSDWSPSGSKNLLAEMKVAWLVSEARGGVFTPRDLVRMATVNPARMLKWDAAVGSLEPGKRADMMVVDGRSGDPYEHLLKARESARHAGRRRRAAPLRAALADAPVHGRPHGRAAQRGRRRSGARPHRRRRATRWSAPCRWPTPSPGWPRGCARCPSWPGCSRTRSPRARSWGRATAPAPACGSSSSTTTSSTA